MEEGLIARYRQNSLSLSVLLGTGTSRILAIPPNLPDLQFDGERHYWYAYYYCEKAGKYLRGGNRLGKLMEEVRYHLSLRVATEEAVVTSQSLRGTAIAIAMEEFKEGKSLASDSERFKVTEIQSVPHQQGRVEKVPGWFPLLSGAVGCKIGGGILCFGGRTRKDCAVEYSLPSLLLEDSRLSVYTSSFQRIGITSTLQVTDRHGGKGVAVQDPLSMFSFKSHGMVCCCYQIYCPALP